MVRHADFHPEFRALELRRVLRVNVGEHSRLVAAANDLLRQSVVAARHGGVTWDDIGQVLGLSRQAAWKRFHKALPFDEGIESEETD